MAIVIRGDYRREVVMCKTSCLSKSIVEMSGDYSGRGVTVKLTEEEFEFFRQFGPDVGNTIYQTILYSLKHVFNHISDGFHWEFEKVTRVFKTHTYGL